MLPPPNITNVTNVTLAPPPMNITINLTAARPYIDVDSGVFYDDAVCAGAVQIVRIALDGQVFTNSYGPYDVPPSPPPPPPPMPLPA